MADLAQLCVLIRVNRLIRMVVSTFSPMFRAATVAAAVVLAQAPVPPPGPASAATAMLAGRIVDATTNRPVGNAIVTLIYRQSQSAPSAPVPAGMAAPLPLMVLTDSEGRFFFRTLKAGTYEARAERRGYLAGAPGRLRPEGTSTSVILTEGQQVSDLTIRIWKHASIAGTVLDDAGEPVVGVFVYALRRDPASRNFVSGGSVSTDDRGVFRIGSLTAGDYILSVPSIAVTAPDGPAIADGGFAMRPAGAVETTRIGSHLLQSLPWAPTIPKPSDDGSVSIFPTTYFPAPPGSQGDSTIRVTFGEAASVPPIRIRPVNAVRISGTVANVPGSGTQVQLVLVPDYATSLAAENGFETARAVAAVNGEFTMLGVPPGSYRLRASAVPPLNPPVRLPDGSVHTPGPQERQFSWLSEPVVVGARDLTLALTLRPPLRVSGRFAFEGAAPPPRSDQVLRDIVSLVPADGRQLIGSRGGRDPGAAGGTFSILDVIGGSYILMPASPATPWVPKSITWRGEDVIDTPIDLTEDITDVVVTFTDRPISIMGTVRTPSGAPDTEALVIVFPTNPARWSRNGVAPMRLRNTRVTPLGTFRLPVVPPGDYFLAAMHDAAVVNGISPALLQELSKHAVRLRLDEGATVTQELRRVEIK